MLHSFPMMIANSVGGGGFIIQGSGLFDGSSGYLSRTPGTAGDNKTYTIELDYKLNPSGSWKTLLAAGTATGNLTVIAYNAGTGIIEYAHYTGSYSFRLVTTALYRDAAAYGQLVIKHDTTQATASNRIKMFINGTQITAFSTEDYPALNSTANHFNTTVQHSIGIRTGLSAEIWDGYLARATMIDGQALAPTDFGEVTDDGFWQINDASELTFGTNGFLIEGGSAMSAGTDSSGNSNDFSKTGTITATNDSPTNDAANEYGNYCTLSPLWQTRSGTSKSILSNGNLTVKTNGSTIGEALGSIAADSSGKSTYETTVTAVGSICIIGFAGSTYIDGNATFRVAWRNNGIVYFGSSSTYSSSDTYTTGDVVRCELNMTTGALQFFKNGTLASDASSPSFAMHTNVQDSGWLPYIGLSTNASSGVTCNFGASSFAATPTSGFLPIATQNLPTPAVINYQDEYYILADIGHTTGTTTDVHLPKTVSGGAMARIKRTDSTSDWYVFDTVRGANKFFKWNSSAVEDTSTFDDQNLTGTTLTLPSDLATGTYLVEVFYVGSYFQIKTYTGTGSAHAESFPGTLDTAPGFMAFANRTTSRDMKAYHISTTATAAMNLQESTASSTNSIWFNNTEPTTTQFTVGTYVGVNTNTDNHVMYAWANSGPYSYGSYTGNANADGPMINVGGSPQHVWAKNSAGTNQWISSPSLLNTGNPQKIMLLMQTTSAAADHSEWIDINSNGFKSRDASATFNSSALMIYGVHGIQPLTDGAVNQGRADGTGGAPLAIATGGTITLDGDYAINTFNASGTLIFDTAPEDGVEYLVIAGGGGGGGSYRAGGGGAGGYRTATGLAVEAISYAITVGAGGNGGAQTTGSDGANSVFSSITSTGGGGGGTYNGGAGRAGGSGGGGAGASGAGGARNATVQGNVGGAGHGSHQIGGGGGGAGAAGFDGGNGATSGDGGVGLASSISGSSVMRSGGGGAGSYGTGNDAIGGLGGGGAGGFGLSNDDGTAGTANTGGGGGGSGGDNSNGDGGAGGSGVVIVRYKYK